MRRRQLLAGVAALAASAGCVAWDTESETPTTEQAPEAGEPTRQTTRGPPPTPGKSRFAGESVPPIGDATRWYHELDADAKTFVKPGTERDRLPAGMTFTFVNRTEVVLGCGGWSLFKLHDGEWVDVAPFRPPHSCEQVRPGGTLRWSLYANNGRPFSTLQDKDGIYFGFLGGGRYAFQAEYPVPSGEFPAALVELEADPLDVAPVPSSTVDRGGGEVTVSTEKWTSTNGAKLVAEPVESASRTLIAEQCYQQPYAALKNVAPFVADGAERVVVYTNSFFARRAIPDQGPPRFSYRDVAFELAVE